MRTINKEGLELIKAFEGCQLEAYLCPANVWTIGYGHTRTAEPDMVIDKAQAESLLKEDLADAEAAVDRLVVVPINENQFSSLISFTFNVGTVAFERSTLLSMLNAGAGAETVSSQLLRWNKADGRELYGLTRRRLAEQALYLSKDWKIYLS
jgi:GH24 family phage-related lysozyme (muramidase)